MEVAEFCSTSRVVIVAGKGGVGKTTVTAALAVTAARAGRSVLIVEVEGKSGLPAMFDAPTLGYDEIDLAPRVRARFLTPDAALVDYLVTHGMKRISKRLASSGALDVVATAVPGMKDILVLGKVKSIEESLTADLLIVDAPLAGRSDAGIPHLSARTRAARRGAGGTDPQEAGRRRRQPHLPDPARCQVMLVTLAEETPVSEVVDTAFAIEDRAGVALGPVVVNGCFTPLPVAADASSSTILDDARTSDRFVSSREAQDLAHAAAFLDERHTLQQEQIDRLRERLPLPQIELPFVFNPDITRVQLDVLADAFERGIGKL